MYLDNITIEYSWAGGMIMRVKHVGLWNKSDSWGDTEIRVGIPVWVIKNLSGDYYGPYQVLPVSDLYESGGLYGCLVEVETHIDNYLDHLSRLDFVGTSDQDVWSRFNKFKIGK